MNKLFYKRQIDFERGHDCIRFECIDDSPNCRPGAGGSHGINGLRIRFLLKGPRGAVQFNVNTGWLPQRADASRIGVRNIESWNPIASKYYPLPTDLGYHSKKQQYEGQESMGPCEVLGGKNCYYDGSGLNAIDAMYTLVNGGDKALWRFLEDYYNHIFFDAPYPEVTEYPKRVRI
jgi:hypothetical protein